MGQGGSQNIMYLRLFTPFHPNMSVHRNKACCASPVAVTVKPTVAKPANKQQPYWSLPFHVQHQEQRYQERSQGEGQDLAP
jgi:hypothetical protein